MLKTKYALSALGLLVAMTMATDALAQGVFSVSSSIVPRARANGHTELAGGVTLARAASPTGDAGGTVTIDYSAAITNAVGDGTMNTIDVDICGTQGTASTPTTTGTALVSGSSITITVADNDCGAGDALDVSGIRLGIAGSQLTTVSASISASGDIRLGGNANDVPVIRQIVDELEDDGVSADALTVIRHTGDPEGDSEYFKLLIEENAQDSFDGTVLELDFGGIEPGMTITLDAWVSTKAAIKALKPVEFVLVADDDETGDVNEAEDNVLSNDQLAFEGGDDTDSLVMTVTAENNSVGVLMGLGDHFLNEDGELVDDPDTDGLDESMIMGGSLTAAVDIVVIRGKITFDKPPKTTAVSFPLVGLDITASVDVGPIGSAKLPRSGGERRTPRFGSDATTPITVIDVESSQTTLVAPYALATLGFDTGFAISNMNTGKGEIQSGAIMFMLYQNGDDPIEYTTVAGSPGRGLTNGMLEAGATYAVLLTEILTAAGVADGFSGYVKIITDFTGADGIAYISDWAAFSATATLEAE